MDLNVAYAYRARRVRVEFSSPVDTGGYDRTKYALTSEDSTSASPSILKVYAVSGRPNIVELVLEFDMIDSAAYTLIVTSIPAVGGGTISGSARFIFNVIFQPVNIEPIVNDYDVVLFGRDIIWNGQDFEEDGAGDLKRVSGIPNVMHALDRRLKGSPLPYDADYSPNAREFVDSNTATPLGSRLKQQTLRDPRVKSVTVVASETSDGEVVFIISPILIGNRSPEPISTAVKI